MNSNTLGRLRRQAEQAGYPGLGLWLSDRTGRFRATHRLERERLERFLDLPTKFGEYARMFGAAGNVRDVCNEESLAHRSPVDRTCRLFRTAVMGWIPTSSEDVNNSERVLRRWLRDKTVTEPEQREFRAHIDELAKHKHVQNAAKAERVHGKRLLTKIVSLDDDVVYCASYPKFLRDPDGSRDETWLKVGRTTRSVLDRTAEMRRVAGVPEDLQVLRLFRPSGPRSLRDCETATLRTLRQVAPRASDGTVFGGREWFLSTLEQVEDAAADAGLTALDLDLDTWPVVMAPTSNHGRAREV